MYVEENSGTREFFQNCMACGYHNSFDYMRNENGVVRKQVRLPVGTAVLTVRCRGDEASSDKIVWESALPQEVDTDFVACYMNEQDDVLIEKYPLFQLPDMTALQAKHGFGIERCIEKRLSTPAGKDGLPSARLNNRGTHIEVYNEDGQTVLLIDRAKYRHQHRPGYGMIIVEYTDGRPAFCRFFSYGTSVRRAEQLWASHTDGQTDHNKSYLTIMDGDKLRILRGSLSAITAV